MVRSDKASLVVELSMAIDKRVLRAKISLNMRSLRRLRTLNFVKISFPPF